MNMQLSAKGKKAVIFGPILIIVLIVLSNPLRESNENIRKSLLKKTPIGTSVSDVISVVEKDPNWKIRYVNSDIGYYVSPAGYPSVATKADMSGKGVVVGEKSIRVYLGRYGLIFETYVSAFYGFDCDGKLVDIAILKETDTL